MFTGETPRGAFDFVYRVNNSGKLFYDGDSQTAKQCFDPQRAIEWYGSAIDFQEYTIKVFNLVTVMKVPYSTGGLDITDKFKVFLYQAVKARKIDDFLLRNWEYFLQHWDVVFDKIVCFKKKVNETQKDIDFGLLNMKNFIYGFRRFDDFIGPDNKPIKVGDSYYNGNPDGNKGNITYKHKGKEYSTPIHGVYVPQFVQSTFGSVGALPSGKPLQAWQREFLYNMGQINHLFHSRGAGKSLVMQLIMTLMSVAQNLHPSAALRPVLINYFSQTEEANVEMWEYIKNIVSLNGEKYFEVKDSQMRLQVVDYRGGTKKVTAVVQFRSGMGKTKGRGGRPFAVIIDEGARQDKSVYETAIGNVMSDDTIIVCLSTIDAESEKNWMYEEAMMAMFGQMDYEPIDDLVVRLWRKYKVDEWTSPDKVNKSACLEMRKEFLRARPKYFARYSLDDVEYLSNEEKEAKIDLFRHKGNAFILSEFYSILVEKTKVLNPSGLLEMQVPQSFERIALAFDKGGASDNPALSITGIADGKIWALGSEILGTTLEVQIPQIKNHIEYWNKKCNGQTNLIVDVSGNSGGLEGLKSFEMRGLRVTLPIYISMGSGVSRNGRVMNVSKEVLVQNAKEVFDASYLRINQELDVENGLIYELLNFGSYKTPSGKTGYKGLTGHDDQVDALCMGLYFLYSVLGYKKRFVDADVAFNQSQRMKLTEAEEMQILKDFNRKPKSPYGAFFLS